jgi:hypothetical protein
MKIRVGAGHFPFIKFKEMNPKSLEILVDINGGRICAEQLIEKFKLSILEDELEELERLNLIIIHQSTSFPCPSQKRCFYFHYSLTLMGKMKLALKKIDIKST